MYSCLDTQICDRHRTSKPNGRPTSYPDTKIQNVKVRIQETITI